VTRVILKAQPHFRTSHNVGENSVAQIKENPVLSGSVLYVSRSSGICNLLISSDGLRANHEI